MRENVFPSCKLRDVADIRVSNVDKKTFSAEIPVKLCNYLDVYTNDYITANMDFMVASASKAEIERFGLLRGDVIITKDSETPDDIGIPAAIVETVDNLVCGYHLAMMRPRNGKIDPIYLAKQLSTSSSSKYFAVHASGSTRFGLSIGAIENLTIPLAPKQEQTQIAEILITVDRAIQQTEALIAKQQRIKTGLMQDLLTRGMDERGHLRSEKSHKFKDSPVGRIPVEWDIKTIGDLAVHVGSGVTPTGGDSVYTKEGTLFIRSQNVHYSGLRLHDVAWIPLYIHNKMLRSEVFENDVLLNITGASIGRCCRMPRIDGSANVNQHVCAIRLKDLSESDAGLLAAVLESHIGQNQIAQFNAGGNREGLNYQQVRSFQIPWPRIKEERSAAYKVICQSATTLTRFEQCARKLRALKSGLMQDLLTGNRRVTSLLTKPLEASA